MEEKSKEEVLAESLGYSSIESMQSEFNKKFLFVEVVEYALKAMDIYAQQQNRDLQLSHDAIVHKLMAIREQISTRAWCDDNVVLDEIEKILKQDKEGRV